MYLTAPNWSPLNGGQLPSLALVIVVFLFLYGFESKIQNQIVAAVFPFKLVSI